MVDSTKAKRAAEKQRVLTIPTSASSVRSFTGLGRWLRKAARAAIRNLESVITLTTRVSSSQVWNPPLLSAWRLVRIPIASRRHVAIAFLGCSAAATGNLLMASEDATTSVSVVSVAEPLEVGTSSQQSPDPTADRSLRFSASEIAQVAASMSGAAKVIEQNGFSDESVAGCVHEDARRILREVRSSAARRIREETAANAVKLHYGIAATYQAEEILQKTNEELGRQVEIQNRLMASGTSIPDPTMLDRLAIDWKDRWLENVSKRSQLRIQLSDLIGSPLACEYRPLVEPELKPSDMDVCEYKAIAVCSRAELILIRRLRSLVSEDTIDTLDSLSGYLSGGPVLPAKPLTLARKLKRSILRDEVVQAVQNRKRWLDTLYTEQSQKIVVDIEVAYEKKKSAALRWSNAQEQVSSWQLRLAQLEKVGEEFQGNIAQQSEARLQLLKVESPKVERWLDWQVANVDLMNASGILLQEADKLR